MELLAFASRQFALKIVDLSVRIIHSHFAQFFLVNQRIVRRKPPEERNALYTIPWYILIWRRMFLWRDTLKFSYFKLTVWYDIQHDSAVTGKWHFSGEA